MDVSLFRGYSLKPAVPKKENIHFYQPQQLSCLLCIRMRVHCYGRSQMKASEFSTDSKVSKEPSTLGL